MLTGMTERDWAIVLEVFDAAQSRRGQPGHDDRKFLEALRYFSVHTITYRTLPAEFGKWNSVWKRFWRLSRSGVFEAFFQCWRNAARRHIWCNRSHLGGNALDFHLTCGEASDSPQFETSLDIGPDICPRIALTDKGYDSPVNRTAARARGIAPAIPRRENAKQRARFLPKRLYKPRARIEQTIGKLKRFKRVAMRCEKTDISYSAIISLACGLMLVRSVHTA